MSSRHPAKTPSHKNRTRLQINRTNMLLKFYAKWFAFTTQTDKANQCVQIK